MKGELSYLVSEFSGLSWPQELWSTSSRPFPFGLEQSKWETPKGRGKKLKHTYTHFNIHTTAAQIVDQELLVVHRLPENIAKAYPGVWVKFPSTCIQRGCGGGRTSCRYLHCWTHNSSSQSDSLLVETDRIIESMTLWNLQTWVLSQAQLFIGPFYSGQGIHSLLISVTWPVLLSTQVYGRDQRLTVSEHSESHRIYYKI